MVALQSHNIDQLSKMSMMSGLTDEQIRKKWDFTLNQAEKYYVFFYHIEGGSQSSDTTGSVKVRMIHDADKPGSYDELCELPMVKVKDAWKVDVRGMSRDFMPGLPR